MERIQSVEKYWSEVLLCRLLRCQCQSINMVLNAEHC